MDGGCGSEAVESSQVDRPVGLQFEDAFCQFSMSVRSDCALGLRPISVFGRGLERSIHRGFRDLSEHGKICERRERARGYCSTNATAFDTPEPAVTYRLLKLASAGSCTLICCSPSIS